MSADKGARPKHTAAQTAARASLAVAVGAAAMGVVAGMAASAGRKAVIQAAESLTGDWADLLQAEHLMIAEIFDLIMVTPTKNVGRRRRLARRLKAALDKHAFQEENAVYPALKLADPDGEAAKHFADHAAFKVLLYQLCRADAAGGDWMPLIHTLRREFEAHAREEEETLFPGLRRLLSSEEQALLTGAVQRSGQKLI